MIRLLYRIQGYLIAYNAPSILVGLLDLILGPATPTEAKYRGLQDMCNILETRNPESADWFRNVFGFPCKDRWYVVQDVASGKYADGSFGWDAAIHDEEQIFKGDSLPYHYHPSFRFIAVGNTRPTVEEVNERLNRG